VTRKLAARNAEVVKLYEAGGLTMAQIGERFGVTKARISQIICRHGSYAAWAVAAARREACARGFTAEDSAKGLAVFRARAAAGSYRAVDYSPIEVARRISRGETYGQIARALGISRCTVAGALYRLRQREQAA
jgi:DNA-binding CsgD family transcriptional regulator